ncbi:hypothetical protein NST36_19145 [Bacillus sp. FSL R5-0293]|uniref:hypothetical protein n=1 Tax=Bacillus sp. FSL R5-0293 TaxID=2954584 RepID=UPI0030F64DAD
MYYIVFMKSADIEKETRLLVDQPLTFTSANNMVMIESERLLQLNSAFKLSYKILEVETGEIIFKGRMQIGDEGQTLFSVILDNSTLPKAVVDYVKKVESNDLVEIEDQLHYVSHSEEKDNLMHLKKEKQEIEEAMKKQEEESKRKELEFRREMDRIAAEKKALEEAIQSKEQESEEQAVRRQNELKRLEKEREYAIKSIEDHREIEKKNVQQFEDELKENMAKKVAAEEELKTIRAAYEKRQIEQANELKAIENNTKDAQREIDLVKAEMEKDELKHKMLKSEANQELPAADPPSQELNSIDDEPERPEAEQKENQSDRLKQRVIKPIQMITKNRTKKKENREASIAISDSFHEDNLTIEMKAKLTKIIEEVGADEKKKAEEQRKAEIRRVKKEKRIKEAIKMSRLRRPFYERIRYLFTGFLLCAAVLFFLINGFEKPFNSAKQIYQDIHTKVESSWAAFQNDK